IQPHQLHPRFQGLSALHQMPARLRLRQVRSSTARLWFPVPKFLVPSHYDCRCKRPGFPTLYRTADSADGPWLQFQSLRPNLVALQRMWRSTIGSISHSTKKFRKYSKITLTNCVTNMERSTMSQTCMYAMPD